MPGEDDERDDDVFLDVMVPSFDEEIMAKFEGIVNKARTPSPEKISFASRRSASMPTEANRPGESSRAGISQEQQRVAELQEKLALRNEMILKDASRIAELEEKLERRNATINDMRRDFALELLQLRMSGASEANRLDAANRAMERLKRDDEKIRAVEQEKEQLGREIALKNQEILALTKEAQMKENRYKKIKYDMQNSIYNLEDNLRACQADLKQKKNLLNSRNAMIEQLHYSISQRDESYLKLEEKLAGILLVCENHENTNNTLRGEIDQVSELLVNSQQNFKQVKDDLTVLRFEKDTVDATLAKWKGEYAALTERYKTLVEQFDELASLKREQKREERARRRSTRKMSKLNISEGALQSLQEEFNDQDEDDDEDEDEQSSGVDGGRIDMREDTELDVSATPLPSGRRPPSANKGVTRRKLSTKQIPPSARKHSATGKSPRRVSLAHQDSGGSGPAVPPLQAVTGSTEGESGGDTRISVRKRRLTGHSAVATPTMNESDSASGTPSPREKTRIHRHTQTDTHTTEYGQLLERTSWLEHELDERKGIITSLEEHMFQLNTQISDLKSRLDDQVKKTAEHEVYARKWRSMVDDGSEANGVTDAELKGSFGHGVLARVKMKTERYHELEAAQTQLQHSREEIQQLQAALEEAFVEIKRAEIENNRLMAANQGGGDGSRRSRRPLRRERDSFDNDDNDGGITSDLTPVVLAKALQRRKGNIEALERFITRNNKSTQCGESVETCESEVQTTPPPKVCIGTETLQRGPLVPPSYCSEESFLTFIFKEVGVVCRHFKEQSATVRKPLWTLSESPIGVAQFVESEGGDEMRKTLLNKFVKRERDLLAYIDYQKRVNSHCRKLITSLVSLRSDMISEMKQRGGEWMSPNSRTIMWTLETILLSLESCLDTSSGRDEKNDRTEIDIARRAIHSAPAGGRTDNSMTMEDSISTVVSHELDYIAAGRTHAMSRMMKTLLKSSVTGRISREPELPAYELLPRNPCKWDDYDDDDQRHCVGPNREIFGRTYAGPDEDENDVSRRNWDREVLSAGVGRGKLLLSKGQSTAENKKERDQDMLAHPQGKDVYESDRIIIAHAGGMSPAAKSVPSKSSLKHSNTSRKNRHSPTLLTQVSSSPSEQNKKGGVTFSPSVDDAPARKSPCTVPAGYDIHQVDNITTDKKKRAEYSPTSPTPVSLPSQEKEVEEFIILHRRIEPILPAARKPPLSPRKQQYSSAQPRAACEQQADVDHFELWAASDEIVTASTISQHLPRRGSVRHVDLESEDGSTMEGLIVEG